MSRDIDKTTNQPPVLDSDCLEAFDHVYAYLNNEISDPAILARIEHHLSHCKSCYSRTEMERKINRRLQDARENNVSERLQNRLKNLIDDFE